MEIQSFLASNFRAHYKKLLILGTASLAAYLIKRYMEKKRQLKTKKTKKKIKDFPTIEEIQKFIEDLPFDAVNTDKGVTLKDLLGELSEFSEDEEWKELIASVHTMYEDNAYKMPEEETVSIMSIYEDPNIITLHGTSVREASTSKTLLELEIEGVINYEDVSNFSKGEGDAKIISLVDNCEKKEDINEFEMLIRSSGDGDNTDIEKAGDSSLDL